MFSDEFLKRMIQRNILGAFGFDIKKAKSEIGFMMRNRSVVIDNPDKRYLKQKICLIEIPDVGLCKIPVADTRNRVIAITIATPVTDSRMVEAFLSKSEKNNKKKENS